MAGPSRSQWASDSSSQISPTRARRPLSTKVENTTTAVPTALIDSIAVRRPCPVVMRGCRITLVGWVVNCACAALATLAAVSPVPSAIRWISMGWAGMYHSLRTDRRSCRLIGCRAGGPVRGQPPDAEGDAGGDGAQGGRREPRQGVVAERVPQHPGHHRHEGRAELMGG